MYVLSYNGTVVICQLYKIFNNLNVLVLIAMDFSHSLRPWQMTTNYITMFINDIVKLQLCPRVCRLKITKNKVTYLPVLTYLLLPSFLSYLLTYLNSLIHSLTLSLTHSLTLNMLKRLLIHLFLHMNHTSGYIWTKTLVYASTLYIFNFAKLCRCTTCIHVSYLLYRLAFFYLQASVIILNHLAPTHLCWNRSFSDRQTSKYSSTLVILWAFSLSWIQTAYCLIISAWELQRVTPAVQAWD